MCYYIIPDILVAAEEEFEDTYGFRTIPRLKPDDNKLTVYDPEAIIIGRSGQVRLLKQTSV